MTAQEFANFDLRCERQWIEDLKAERKQELAAEEAHHLDLPQQGRAGGAAKDDSPDIIDRPNAWAMLLVEDEDAYDDFWHDAQHDEHDEPEEDDFDLFRREAPVPGM